MGKRDVPIKEEGHQCDILYDGKEKNQHIDLILHLCRAVEHSQLEEGKILPLRIKLPCRASPVVPMNQRNSSSHWLLMLLKTGGIC